MRQRLLQLWLAAPSAPYAWLLETTPRARCLHAVPQPCSLAGTQALGVSSTGALLPVAGLTWWTAGLVGRGLAVLCLVALGLTAVARVGRSALLDPRMPAGHSSPQLGWMRTTQPQARGAVLPGAPMLSRPALAWWPQTHGLLRAYGLVQAYSVATPARSWGGCAVGGGLGPNYTARLLDLPAPHPYVAPRLGGMAYREGGVSALLGVVNDGVIGGHLWCAAVSTRALAAGLRRCADRRDGQATWSSLRAGGLRSGQVGSAGRRARVQRGWGLLGESSRHPTACASVWPSVGRGAAWQLWPQHRRLSLQRRGGLQAALPVGQGSARLWR